jgi:serine/threonine-protein kinase HipA
MRKFDEPLYLTDLNIDSSRAYYGVRKGHIERVVKDVFISTSLGPDERRDVLRRNAARIATRAFSNAILAGSSAFHRGAVEGHVLLATPWGGKPVDVGGAFTIYFTRSQVDVGMNREVKHVSIEDDFGPYTVKRMADDMLIIKNFQRQKGRPEATYLNVTDLAEVVERSMRTLGGREQLMHRLKGLVGHHGLAVYEDSIKSFVERVGSYTQASRPLKSFKVYWHKNQVATLSHDGHIWSFDYEPSVKLQLSVRERVGKRSPPSFLGSILPEMGPQAEGTMEERLDNFRNGSRYISNITVHPAGAAGAQDIIVDTLDGELAKFKTNKLEFAGRIDRRFLSTAEDDVLLGQLQDNPSMPRISGMQVKLAAHLDARGELSAAIGKSFTHILKVPAGQPQYSTLGSMEWYSLTIAKMCGMNIEEFALVDLGERGPGVLVERFDVRRDLNDTRMILTEDFWSVAGMTDNNQKYKGELMDVADAVAKHSTDAATDGRHLLAQAIFSWLTWNGDMHLKNLLLVKETRDPRAGFESVRLSPGYDILCTQVYPGDAKTSAIGLCGNRNHTLAGFRALGKKFGIMTSEVDAMVDFLSASIPMWARKVASNLPDCIKSHEPSMAHIERAKALFDVRCMMMIAELEGSKRKRSTKSADDEAAEAVHSFSAEQMTGVAEHVEAERRRSWVPTAAEAAATIAAATNRTRP